jgi:hypothetical protein
LLERCVSRDTAGDRMSKARAQEKALDNELITALLAGNGDGEMLLIGRESEEES